MTKDFCGALAIPRVSFASEEHLLSMMGTPHGATTVLALALDTDRRIELVMDRAIAQAEFISCTDGTNTGFVRLRMDDLLHRYLPHTGHNPQLIG